ncbi:hypothetical protein E2986_13788 [Frieseomelitta varia]|uniref:Uncharacterized protein n=1 Tax=Frieseomelitta varia TaxID=561572 RepID=A0A833VLF4_9HYME|nr:hypothetical protein E2986_13788 [Frieseomelitta varia]
MNTSVPTNKFHFLFNFSVLKYWFKFLNELFVLQLKSKDFSTFNLKELEIGVKRDIERQERHKFLNTVLSQEKQLKLTDKLIETS